MKLPSDYDSALLRAVLDRPIRVCGMVRNEGEPGGGPFWVANPDGTESLQIAESSQIAPADQPLMQAATHFNPVDLVCGIRDSKGRKFDLRRYTDPATGFISSKSAGGRPLRAQGAPGALERRDGTVEHRLRRCSDHDLLSRQSGAGPAAPPNTGSR